MVLFFVDFLLRRVTAGQKGMTLVGEIDFQLLELNLADKVSMYHTVKRFRILRHSSFEAESVRRLTCGFRATFV